MEVVICPEVVRRQRAHRAVHAEERVGSDREEHLCALDAHLVMVS